MLSPAMLSRSGFVLTCVGVVALVQAAESDRLSQPQAGPDLVFEEQGGFVAVEAEHFFRQTKTEVRSWQLTTADQQPQTVPDGDPPHVAGASGGAYLEALPDTRRTHGDRLIKGENFMNEPGKMAVLHYKVHFNTPGKYYVWARTHSTGTEDNGLHVGIDGTWPESGQRMQWTAKRKWFWDSKQRTAKVHTGVPGQLFLEVAEPGVHVIAFSMREDGFEFDKWIMTTEQSFTRPSGVGAASRVKSGRMPKPFRLVAEPAASAAANQQPGNRAPRGKDGDGRVTIGGELRQWHKVTLTLDGPFAHETDNQPNPFTDQRMKVTFRHQSGTPTYEVPGYFAADGNAGETSAQSGTKWRAHVSPDKAGVWSYQVSFATGRQAALDDAADASAVQGFDGLRGEFTVAASDKRGVDLRSRGRLTYVGQRYLKFAGSGEYFLKAGPDSPETMLGYRDFDGTETNKVKLKSWSPHRQDWQEGDPAWQGGKGKGLIGAINYLSSQGCNVMSFLPYNAGGDGDNVWPFVARNDKLHYDCSKLDQWGIVFDHAQAKGLYLHFKLQEQEIDDNRRGSGGERGRVAVALDGGKLGVERKLYCRELVARFGHALALNWNLGEENTQSPAEQRAMSAYLKAVDPYDHNIVVHTFPPQQDKVYSQLIGDQSVLTGASLQNHWHAAHQRTLKWVTESQARGRPWVVCNDEQGPASLGVPPDKGFEGFAGKAQEVKDGQRKGDPYSLDDIRKQTLWGTLLAGGAGVEYYFGYQLPQNDLVCEDFRSRHQTWAYNRIALAFFKDHQIPFWSMQNQDQLVEDARRHRVNYCFAKTNELYLVYFGYGGPRKLDLSKASGTFQVHWFNPRTGGPLETTDLVQVAGGQMIDLKAAPSDDGEDWLVVLKRQ